MRSKWKGLYSDPQSDVICYKYRKTKKIIRLTNRGMTILSKFVGLRVAVHTGKIFLKFTIKPFMVGHKIGEFARTKLLGSSIHFRKKKKK